MVKQDKSMLWKVGSGVVAGLVVGGLAFGFGCDDSKEVADKDLVISELSGQVAELNESNVVLGSDLEVSEAEKEALNVSVSDLKMEVSDKDSMILDLMSEDAQDASWALSAEDELDSLSFKKALVAELEDMGYVIDDRDDVEFSIVEDWDVVSDDSDREDGNAVLKSELRVKGFEDGDKDLDFKEYMDIKVVIEEDEVMKVSLS